MAIVRYARASGNGHDFVASGVHTDEPGEQYHDPIHIDDSSWRIARTLVSSRHISRAGLDK